MSHFYAEDGRPVYEVPNKAKPGTMRPTTIREARTLNLSVGVTTILQVASSKVLTDWIIDDTIRACMMNPYDGMTQSTEDYIHGIHERARLELKKSSDRGRELHNEMEKYYTKKTVSDKEMGFVLPAVKKINKMFPEVPWEAWKAEHTFNYKNLYGGSVDLCADGIVLDFKVKDKDGESFEKVKGYDSYKMQIAAYRVGLGMPDAIGGNVFISSKQEGLVKIEIYPKEELDRHFDMFMNLCRYWHLQNKTGRNLNP